VGLTAPPLILLPPVAHGKMSYRGRIVIIFWISSTGNLTEIEALIFVLVSIWISFESFILWIHNYLRGRSFKLMIPSTLLKIKELNSSENSNSFPKKLLNWLWQTNLFKSLGLISQYHKNVLISLISCVSYSFKIHKVIYCFLASFFGCPLK